MAASKLGQLLVEDGLLTEHDRRMIRSSSGAGGSAFAKSLIALGLVDEDELAAFIADRTHFRIASKDLQSETDDRALGAVDVPLLLRLEVLPLKLEGTAMIVAMADPLDRDTIRQLEFFTGYRIKPVIATLGQIRAGLRRIVPDWEPKALPFERFITTHAPSATRRIRATLPSVAAATATAADATGVAETRHESALPTAGSPDRYTDVAAGLETPAANTPTADALQTNDAADASLAGDDADLVFDESDATVDLPADGAADATAANADEDLSAAAPVSTESIEDPLLDGFTAPAPEPDAPKAAASGDDVMFAEGDELESSPDSNGGMDADADIEIEADTNIDELLPDDDFDATPPGDESGKDATDEMGFAIEDQPAEAEVAAEAPPKSVFAPPPLPTATPDPLAASEADTLSSSADMQAAAQAMAELNRALLRLGLAASLDAASTRAVEACIAAGMSAGVMAFLRGPENFHAAAWVDGKLSGAAASANIATAITPPLRESLIKTAGMIAMTGLPGSDAVAAQLEAAPGHELYGAGAEIGDGIKALFVGRFPPALAASDGVLAATLAIVMQTAQKAR